MSESNGKDGGKDGPYLIPQPHGGAILSGGRKGQTPGPGRPPSQIKHALRNIAEESLPKIREFALGMVRHTEEREVTLTCPECEHEVSSKVEFEFLGPPKGSDQARVWDMLLRHGLDVQVDKSLVDEIWDAIEAHVPDEVRPTLKDEINKIVGRRLAEAVLR